MKKIISCLVLLGILFNLNLHQPQPVLAQENQMPIEQNQEEDFEMEAVVELEPVATDSATPSAEASISAQLDQRILERRSEDITESGGEKRSRLASLIIDAELGPLTWHNFLQHAIRNAVVKGLPANIIVLLLLFPLIAAIIAASRHIIGLGGFGIYIPAVLSIAFVSTEIVSGIIIFLAVIIGAVLTRKIVKSFRFPYLPRTAMILWGVSVFILALLILSSQIALFELLTISIFPILIIILLTENFMESQIFSSQKEALRITLETLLVAIICSLIISQNLVQEFVLLHPELTLVSTAAVNYLIGRYTGLRLLEVARFGSIMGQESYNYPTGHDQTE